MGTLPDPERGATPARTGAASTEIEPASRIRDHDTPAVQQLTEDEARVLIGRMRQTTVVLAEQIERAYFGRAWVALEYSSWDEMIEAEIPQLKLERGDRRQVVATLREAGLSTRAISSATGASRNTVRADLRHVGQIDPPVAPADDVVVDAEIIELPAKKITGTDGKKYSSPKRTRHPIHKGTRWTNSTTVVKNITALLWNEDTTFMAIEAAGGLDDVAAEDLEQLIEACTFAKKVLTKVQKIATKAMSA